MNEEVTTVVSEVTSVPESIIESETTDIEMTGNLKLSELGKETEDNEETVETTASMTYEEFMAMNDPNYRPAETTTEIFSALDPGEVLPEFQTEATEEMVETTIVTLEVETVETEAVTTVATTEAVTVVEPSGFDISTIGQYKDIILIAIVAIACVIMLPLLIKNKSKTAKNARERDAERIAEIKKDENEKKKKKTPKKSAYTIGRKNVASSLPYRKCLPNDIWQLDDTRYSKVYRIDDINYNLGDEDQQDNILYNYRMFLNSLDDTEECQITVMNEPIDIEQYEKDALVQLRGDGFDHLRNEYNERVLKPALSKGNNAIRKAIYVTMTVKSPDIVIAERRFKTIDLKLKNAFDKIGSTRLEPLTNRERLEILKTFFIEREYKLPNFTDEELKKGTSLYYSMSTAFNETKEIINNTK